MLSFGLDGVGRAYRRLGTRRGRPAQHLRRTQRVEVGWGCAASMAMPLSALRRGPMRALRRAWGNGSAASFPTAPEGSRHGTQQARPSSWPTVASRLILTLSGVCCPQSFPIHR